MFAGFGSWRPATTLSPTSWGKANMGWHLYQILRSTEARCSGLEIKTRLENAVRMCINNPKAESKKSTALKEQTEAAASKESNHNFTLNMITETWDIYAYWRMRVTDTVS